jgi:hypothetical protein
MEFLLPPVAPPRRPSWSDIGLNAIDSQMCSGWTETAMPILFVVMSSDITDPTALRQSNKLATFDGATRAVDSFDAIMVCSTTLKAGRLATDAVALMRVVVVSGDFFAVPLFYLW